jgi:DNA-directed RNA polymerase sigma subunit (sigma70/sigma32)
MGTKRKHENLRHGQLCSQADIAEMWGVSPTRVSQIEQRAIAKLRAAIEKFADEAGVTIREWLSEDLT